MLVCNKCLYFIGTSVNKLPWILLGVCIPVVIFCAILWCIIKRVRRRRGNQPPNPTSDPTNNTSPTPDAVYYSDAVTINPLRPNDDDEIHYDNISPRYDTISPRVDYDTLSPRVDGGEGNYSALSRKKGRSKPKCTLL
ncbi:hypothetical protein SNE40_004774 [Patella caerulea]|uniref:Uncharacterized protein n=1 Tax=Patella caerulea TaxID=87958 RepID=A0AAN8PXL0_PATCE